MSVCQIEERDAGRGYPRTCPTCKLSGACAKGLDRKGLMARVEALEARHANDCEEIAKWREVVSGRTMHEGLEVVWRERVKRLEAENERLRDALRHIVSRSSLMSAEYIAGGGESGHERTARIARAALEGKG